MTNGRLLWVDDEIEMLRPHILFLEKKGYEIDTATNGADAIDLCRESSFDLILLDENMPGLSGLETLMQLKELTPNVPVVMVTKNEEEDLMEQAIGSKIADYLIKPVNPNQILLTLKKNIHAKELVQEVAQTGYRQDFARIGMQLSENLTAEDWKELYKKLVFWEMELATTDSNMTDMLQMQKEEANLTFAKFVRKNYEEWITNPDSRPLMSPDIFKRCVFPRLSAGRKVLLLVLDNCRFDQWRMLSAELSDDFDIEENLYYSILPTATQYARNAIFAGLMPYDIAGMYPQYWVEEDEDEGLNVHEEELIRTQLERFRRKESFQYTKLNDSPAGEKFLQRLNATRDLPLQVVVINFIDMLSHARTESKMIRELASNDAAYRSITESWFRHSSALDIFRRLSELGYKVIVTTDHGTIRVDNPIKVIGDRNTNTNLRYKCGKNLSYNTKQVFEIRNPRKFGLPTPNISSAYIFAMNEDFFSYPNNYNYYVQYYTGTFQHGGISLQEMLVPLVTMTPKG